MSISFSPAQQKAFDMFGEGTNLCIVGPGGTGKSFLIHSLYENAKKRSKDVYVTALTGCAAFLLMKTGARTIHSWSGVYRF